MVGGRTEEMGIFGPWQSSRAHHTGSRVVQRVEQFPPPFGKILLPFNWPSSTPPTFQPSTTLTCSQLLGAEAFRYDVFNVRGALNSLLPLPCIMHVA